MDGYNNTTTGLVVNGLSVLSPEITYTILGILIVIILISAIGNTLVLYIIYNVPSLQSISSFLVANLAITDLCMAVLRLPMVGVTTVNHGWKLGPELCTAMGFLDGILTKEQVMALLCIGINRYIAVHRPTFYSSSKNKRFCKWCVIFGWLYSLAWSLPPLFGLGDYSYIENTMFCGLAWNTKTLFEAIHIGATAILPGFIGLFIYSSVLYGVFKHVRKVNSNLQNKDIELKEVNHNSLARNTLEPTFDSSMVSESSQSRNIGKGQKTVKGQTPTPKVARKIQKSKDLNQITKAFLMIVLTFSVCWIPRGIANIWTLLKDRKSVPLSLEITSTLLIFSTAAFNPLVYGYYRTDMRNALKVNLGCV